MTPDFFEHYAYAYATLIFDQFDVKPGDSIVVGWDPRDCEGSFNQAATDGLRKAGLRVIQIGVIPIPAIPLYMLSLNAVGGMVLTASHNPSDQNGIKLFHGFTGLKFLPGDDQQLSRIIFQQKDLDLTSKKIIGQLDVHDKKAKEFFVNYCLQSENSWIRNPDFTDTILVIDASKGAMATVVREVFAHYQFYQTHFTNMSGNINECCGVADIEDRKIITADEVIGANAAFGSYQALTTLFKASKEIPGAQTGEIRLVGLVFDGDGDRCYRLDYSPQGDALLVSSGDCLGIHQALFIKGHLPSKSARPLFVNTVESDLNTAIKAQEMGFQSKLTGVGDKWILLRAVIDSIQSQIQNAGHQTSDLLNCINDVTQSETPSGLKLSLLWKEYILTRPTSSCADRSRFRIGIEASGHCITPGWFNAGNKSIRTFAGNGLKTGLNSLEAIRHNHKGKDPEYRDQNLWRPFPSGLSKTFYIYYVNKELLAPGHSFRKELINFSRITITRGIPKPYTCEQIPFPEENTLIFFKITQNGNSAGSLFIRNSGTEDKSAVYLRGKQEILPFMQTIGDDVHLYLLSRMKDPSNEFARFETKILRTILANKSIDDLLTKNRRLPVQRILREIELKERLLCRREGQLQLSDKGKAFLHKNGLNIS